MLEDERIKLRAMEPKDVDLLFEWENNPDIWPVSSTVIPYSRHILLEFINSHQDIFSTGQLRLMITLKKEEQTIGCIDLFDFDPLHLRAGVGILVANQQHRGKGYAGNALNLLIDYTFNYLKLHQLYSSVAANNAASLKLFTGNGFVQTGIKKDWLNEQGLWLDEHLLQLINASS
jgi:diamine N-acetyltransferase